MSYRILKSNITINKNLISKLNEFYTELRNGKTLTGKVNEYKESMQSQTKSKSSRQKRVNALCSYLGIDNSQ